MKVMPRVSSTYYCGEGRSYLDQSSNTAECEVESISFEGKIGGRKLSEVQLALVFIEVLALAELEF